MNTSTKEVSKTVKTVDLCLVCTVEDQSKGKYLSLVPRAPWPASEEQ